MTSVLDKFAKISTKKKIIIRDYLLRNINVSVSNSLELKKSFNRIDASIWNSIPLSVKTLNISNFRKKKSILFDVLDNKDN